MTPDVHRRRFAAVMEVGGYSNSGRRYRTIDDLWRRPAPGSSSSAATNDIWYGKSRDFWEQTELTDDGVLGGFGHISDVDLSSSRRLIESLTDLPRNHAIDCGAGIGRITKGLLLPLFARVDLVEQSPAHVDAARAALARDPRMGAFHQAGLQAFAPAAADRYDLVWVQWVVGYLTDADLERFLDRCAAALSGPEAVVVVKENVARRQFFVDADDNNVTRTLAQFRALFARTRLELVRTRVQDGFPAKLHPVYMFVLRRRRR